MPINLSSALSTFNSAGIDINADYLTLPSSQVDVIVQCAKQDGYRKSKSSSKSRAHAYFCALQRDYKKFKEGY